MVDGVSFAFGMIERLRGLVSQSEAASAIYIIKELQKEFPMPQNKKQNLWNAAQRLAVELEIRMPFTNEGDFLQIYNSLSEDVDYETVFGQIHKNSGGRVLFLTQSFADIIVEKMSDCKGRSLIANASVFFPYLKKIIRKNNNCKYTLTADNSFDYRVLKSIFSDWSNVNIIETSTYKYDFIDEKFDTILSIPVFGMRLDDNLKDAFMCREAELASTENLLLHLSPAGKLITLLPARITFAAGNVANLRRFIQDSYCVEEISEMPSGILSSTAIKTFLFTFSSEKKGDTSVKRFVFENDSPINRRNDTLRLTLSDETFVMPSELEDQGDWNVDKIFAGQDDDWQKYQSSKIKKVLLKDVAEVFRGKAVSQKNEQGRIGVVNISNITEKDIKYDDLDHLEEDERKVLSYILKDDDVLLPARGTAIRTAVFQKQLYPCIASANLVVIRPKEGLLSGIYLKIFLDSPIGKKLIKATQQGTTVINISYKDLMNIEIPYLPYSEQMEMADQYANGLKLYTETVFEAEKKWSSVINDLQNKIKG